MSWAIKHDRMIRSIARTVHRRARSAGALIELDDLVQEGAIVAIRAEAGYSQSKGAESTYLHTSLYRALNEKADIAVYRGTNEIGQIDDYEPGFDNKDDLKLWDFMRGLSQPAQRLLMSWLMPQEALLKQIQARTVGRRCSFRALIHYLREQGCDSDKLQALQDEIYSKAGIHES